MALFTESEIDDILGAVEESMQSAAALAKNFPPAEEDEEQGDAPEMGAESSHEIGTEGEEQPGGDPAMGGEGDPAMGGEGDPAMGGEGDPAMGGDEEMGGDPAMGGEGDPAMGGDDALANEGEDGEISDEELHQIYASMDPSELERHYMIVRGLLRDAYAKMEKSETNNNEGTKVEKKELEDKVANLEKSNKELEASLQGAIKAMQLIAKPTRKAITENVQILGKSEGDNGNEGDNFPTDLSKSEIVAKINDRIRDTSLTKNDRDVFNDYLLRNSGKEDVIKILGRK